MGLLCQGALALRDLFRPETRRGRLSQIHFSLRPVARQASKHNCHHSHILWQAAQYLFREDSILERRGDQIFGEQLENVVFVITKDENRMAVSAAPHSKCLNNVLCRTSPCNEMTLRFVPDHARPGRRRTRWQPIANSAERAEEGSGFRE